MIWLAIISLTLAVYLVARWTVKRMKRGDYIDHRDKKQRRKEWLIKAASSLPAVFLFWWKYHWWAIPMCMTWYWLAFDACMGILLDKGIFYTGTVWAGQAKTASVPFAVKVGLCGIFVILYVNSLTHFLWHGKV